MIGKLIGAMIGERASRNVDGINETGGALLGAAAIPLVRRLGPIGLIAVAAGAYAYKRHQDKKLKAARVAPIGV